MSVCSAKFQNCLFFWQWPLQNKKAWILYSNWWTTVFDFPKFINPWKWLWFEKKNIWIKEKVTSRQGGRNRWSQWSQAFTGNQSFYYREILRSWMYEGGNFLCFTGKKLVLTPLHLEFLKMLSSFCCIKTNSFFKYQIEISSLQIKE